MNPLFNALFGTKQAQIPSAQGQVQNSAPQDMNALMGQLRANPAEVIRNAGYNVPDEIAGNPQATVMHLLQTGQINNPMMQRIGPMLRMMGVR